MRWIGYDESLPCNSKMFFLILLWAQTTCCVCMKPPGICNMDSPSPEWVVMRDEALLSLMLALFTFTALSLGAATESSPSACRQRGPVHACMQPYHLLSEQKFQGRERVLGKQPAH